MYLILRADEQIRLLALCQTAAVVVVDVGEVTVTLTQWRRAHLTMLYADLRALPEDVALHYGVALSILSELVAVHTHTAAGERVTILVGVTAVWDLGAVDRAFEFITPINAVNVVVAHMLFLNALSCLGASELVLGAISLLTIFFI
jgi:hypothetical protein